MPVGGPVTTLRVDGVRPLEHVLHAQQPVDQARTHERHFAEIDHGDSALRPDMARLLVQQRNRREIVLTTEHYEPRAAIVVANDRFLNRVARRVSGCGSCAAAGRLRGSSRKRAGERSGRDCGHSGTSTRVDADPGSEGRLGETLIR